ncbi:GumC family protein [Selenomonas sp. oral taxon 138]|uniref:GumC family protein n=1 Tax=Selenomonas sp. oral taxon 138 TaxID=712532 RepID=UPI0002A20D2B|nr:GumC family protein [Selenomonas sp. oral taxon 138]EKX99355.1 chain length determinant protein [Selenomonas sp. oral taxon 138 str. F0429]
MEHNEDTIDLSRLFRVMGDHKPVILGIVGICTVVALVISLVLPKQYESTTLVQTRTATKVDISGAAAAMAALGVGGGSVSSPTMNYIELMKSRTVLDPIIDSMAFEVDEKPDAKGFAKKYLDIKNTKGTNLIEVAARGKSPEEAQRISQAVVDNFLLMQTDMNQQTQSLLMKFLDDRIGTAKHEAEDAEAKLAQFSREHKLYSPDDQAKAAIEQMAAFDKAIGEVQVAEKSAQASLDAANEKLGEQKSASRAYHISDNTTVQKIRDQIVAKRVELVGLEQKYTELHPSVQQARKELEQLQNSLDVEVLATVESNATTLNPTQSQLLSNRALAAVNLAVATASESALEKQQAKKEEELGTFPDDVMEYMRLSRDSKVKNEVYLNLVKQYEQNKIQAAMESMDIQIIDAANLPDKPVWPKKLLFLLIGAVTGCVVSCIYLASKYKRCV